MDAAHTFTTYAYILAFPDKLTRDRMAPLVAIEPALADFWAR